MDIEQRILELSTPSDTEQLGRRLGENLFPGAVVALSGPLAQAKPFWCVRLPWAWEWLMSGW